MRRDKEYLLDMLEAIEKIESQLRRGEDEFARDEMFQTWVVHHLQIIGEAAGKIAPAFRDASPEIPWAKMTAMRNVLVHEYFGVDLAEIWSTVIRDLPLLKAQINGLLKD